MYKYIAFDVETPRAANDRMNAIGISVIEDGAITKEWFSLVNPEVDFDAFNVQLLWDCLRSSQGRQRQPCLRRDLD